MKSRTRPIPRAITWALSWLLLLFAGVSLSPAQSNDAPSFIAPRAQAPLQVKSFSASESRPINFQTLSRGDGWEITGTTEFTQLAQSLGQSLPGYVESIRSDLPAIDPTLPPIEIRLTHDANDFAAIAPPDRNVPHWAAGVAFPRYGLILLATRQGTNPVNTQNVLAHELSHVLLGRALGYKAPRWLDEGFAYLHSSELDFSRLSVLTSMAWSGSPIPLTQLDPIFYSNNPTRAYAQSYDWVVFLAQRGRYVDKDDDGDRWPFRTFLASLAQTGNLDQSFREAYRTSEGALFSEWWQSLRSRYLLVPVELLMAFIWVAAVILLILGFLRRRRQSKFILSRWEDEETVLSPARVAPVTQLGTFAAGDPHNTADQTTDQTAGDTTDSTQPYAGLTTLRPKGDQTLN